MSSSEASSSSDVPLKIEEISLTEENESLFPDHLSKQFLAFWAQHSQKYVETKELSPEIMKTILYLFQKGLLEEIAQNGRHDIWNILLVLDVLLLNYTFEDGTTIPQRWALNGHFNALYKSILSKSESVLTPEAVQTVIQYRNETPISIVEVNTENPQTKVVSHSPILLHAFLQKQENFHAWKTVFPVSFLSPTLLGCVFCGCVLGPNRDQFLEVLGSGVFDAAILEDFKLLISNGKKTQPSDQESSIPFVQSLPLFLSTLLNVHGEGAQWMKLLLLRFRTLQALNSSYEIEEIDDKVLNSFSVREKCLHCPIYRDISCWDILSFYYDHALSFFVDGNIQLDEKDRSLWRKQDFCVRMLQKSSSTATILSFLLSFPELLPMILQVSTPLTIPSLGNITPFSYAVYLLIFTKRFSLPNERPECHILIDQRLQQVLTILRKLRTLLTDQWTSHYDLISSIEKWCSDKERELVFHSKLGIHVQEADVDLVSDKKSIGVLFHQTVFYLRLVRELGTLFTVLFPKKHLHDIPSLEPFISYLWHGDEILPLPPSMRFLLTLDQNSAGSQQACLCPVEFLASMVVNQVEKTSVFIDVQKEEELELLEKYDLEWNHWTSSFLRFSYANLMEGIGKSPEIFLPWIVNRKSFALFCKEDPDLLQKYEKYFGQLKF